MIGAIVRRRPPQRHVLVQLVRRAEVKCEPSVLACSSWQRQAETAFEPTDEFRQDVYERYTGVRAVAAAPPVAAPLAAESPEHAARAQAERHEREKERQEIASRDVSRMKQWHRWAVKRTPPPMAIFAWQGKRKALKERFGQYGFASGVNPGLLWPTRDELKEKVAIENFTQPHYWPTRRRIEQEAAQSHTLIQQRRDAMDAAWKEYPNVLKAYDEEKKKAAKIVEERQLKQRSKLREAQEHFGYAIDPKDPRYKLLMNKKSQEEEKAAKEAKKKARRERYMAEIKQQE